MHARTPNPSARPRERTLVVLDPSSCGVEAFERAIAAAEPADTDVRAVVVASGRSDDEIQRAVQLLSDVTLVGQRHGFTETGWRVVRSVGELADDLARAARFDRAELVVPASRWIAGRFARVRRTVRRRGAHPHLACAA